MSNEEIKQMAREVVQNTIFCSKAILTVNEAAAYLGISKNYLYKLTMRKEIPYYRPTGKIIYFDRKELEEWIKANNRISTMQEINEQAQRYCMKKGGAI